MPSELHVKSTSGGYTVVVGQGILEEALGRVDALVVDEALGDLVAQATVPVIRVSADETLKTLAGVENLAGQLRAAGLVRSSVLGAVGGGTVQDVTTLTASLYMRGIRWVYVPTTLLGMVDSCIGGKSAINAAGFKNLLGNFYPPSRIIVDPQIARSLTGADIAGGIAEAVKICYASSPEEFQGFVTAVQPHTDLGPDVLEQACWMSLRAKKRIIETDEFDTGERQLLNFGHSFGHALEAATGMLLPHGLGVAVGMRAAIDYSGGPRHPDVQVLDSYSQALTTQARAAGWQPPTVDWDTFSKAFEADKKHTSEQFRLVLPAAHGRLELVSVPRDRHALEEVGAAAHYAWGQL